MTKDDSKNQSVPDSEEENADNAPSDKPSDNAPSDKPNDNAASDAPNENAASDAPNENAASEEDAFADAFQGAPTVAPPVVSSPPRRGRPKTKGMADGFANN